MASRLNRYSFGFGVLWYVCVICVLVCYCDLQYDQEYKLLASFEYSNSPEILWRLVRATVHGLELSLKGITQQMYRVMVEQNEKRARHAMELAPKNKSCLLVSCEVCMVITWSIYFTGEYYTLLMSLT